MSRSRSPLSSAAKRRLKRLARAGVTPGKGQDAGSPTPFAFDLSRVDPSEWAIWPEPGIDATAEPPPSGPLPAAAPASSEAPRGKETAAESRVAAHAAAQPVPRIEIVDTRPSPSPSQGDAARDDGGDPLSSRASVVASVPAEPPPISRRTRARRTWGQLATIAAVVVLVTFVTREREGVMQFLKTHATPRIFTTASAAANVAPPSASEALPPSPCPAEMALVSRDELRVCVDRWEGSVVEVVSGEERPFSPYLSVEGRTVKAISRAGAVPQGYISRDEAEVACVRAQKRLCTEAEWRAACEGPDRTTYPYGSTLDDAACNTHGKSPISELFSTYGDSVWDFRLMNDPSLNALDGTVARTGEFTRCTNGFGVYDMVGNLHEWTAEKAGVFHGGYYQDAEKNGSGCAYQTGAHFATYHDYSTGFRCCKDVP